MPNLIKCEMIALPLPPHVLFANCLTCCLAGLFANDFRNHCLHEMQSSLNLNIALLQGNYRNFNAEQFLSDLRLCQKSLTRIRPYIVFISLINSISDKHAPFKKLRVKDLANGGNPAAFWKIVKSLKQYSTPSLPQQVLTASGPIILKFCGAFNNHFA